MSQRSGNLFPDEAEATNRILTDEEWNELSYRVSRVFTPAAPISEDELFAGRLEQVNKVIDAINQHGQHAVVYGERGVGKTSLSNILASRIVSRSGRQAISPRVNCTVSDSFSSLWRNVFDQIQLTVDEERAGFTAAMHQTIQSAIELVPDPKNITPAEIQLVLNKIGQGRLLIIIFDEFDRLPQQRTVRRTLADTIKTLSDYAVPATLIIVGVAESVSELISEHESVERALVQVLMPRMESNELHEIVEKGIQKLGMQIETDATCRIAMLSQGLPSYTHRLALEAARVSVQDRRLLVDCNDIKPAMKAALAHTQQSILENYRRAVTSPQPNNLFERVLLACALATNDQFGYFSATAVQEPLSRIMGKTYELPSFQRHLKHFSDSARGNVLRREGVPRKYMYRFKNPLMQPFVVMKGVVDGLIGENEATF